MRRPRDFDAELKALNDKAVLIKECKLRQLGELVIATGADALSAEELAGMLLAGIKAEAATREAWRRRGATFFQKPGSPRSSAGSAVGTTAAGGRSSQSAERETGA